MKAATEFTIKTDNPHICYKGTRGRTRTGGSRWYRHREVNGKNVYSASHASRRSARRAILSDMIKEGLGEVQ